MKTLDINGCAEFLKINTTTASELAAAGKLPGAKIGRAWVFLLDDLVDYLRTEVRRQQSQRLEKTAGPTPQPKIDFAKVDVLATFSAIRRKSRGGGRRTPIPVLPELPASPELVCEVASA
ncbi:MAG: helix-turn-helix domain-containing protein [Azonexus sp.]|jgi:hypothetical protein|nr:helix-turn-helix domain-containing protein [Azonexus sp.]